MLAYGYGVHEVSCSMVREAALDTVDVRNIKSVMLLYISLGVFLLLAVIGGVILSGGVFE